MYIFLGPSKRGDKVPKRTPWGYSHYIENMYPQGAHHTLSNREGSVSHSAEHGSELLTQRLTVCGENCPLLSQSAIIGP